MNINEYPSLLWMYLVDMNATVTKRITVLLVLCTLIMKFEVDKIEFHFLSKSSHGPPAIANACSQASLFRLSRKSAGNYEISRPWSLTHNIGIICIIIQGNSQLFCVNLLFLSSFNKKGKNIHYKLQRLLGILTSICGVFTYIWVLKS